MYRGTTCNAFSDVSSCEGDGGVTGEFRIVYPTIRGNTKIYVWKRGLLRKLTSDKMAKCRVCTQDQVLALTLVSTNFRSTYTYACSMEKRVPPINF